MSSAILSGKAIYDCIGMGKSCCAVGCTNRFYKGSGVHFYRFPEDPERRSRWIAVVGRKDWKPNEYSWLCSAHFVSGEKSNNPLSPDYVPSLFAHVNSSLKQKRVRDLSRFERTSEGKKRRADVQEKIDAAESLLKLSEVGNGTNYCEPHTGICTMTELSAVDLMQTETELCRLEKYEEDMKQNREEFEEEKARLEFKICALQTECQHLREECEHLKNGQTVVIPFSEKFFEDDNAKVKYYSGLPNFNTLMAVFDILLPAINTNDCNMLTCFQQVILVLVKLRLNSGNQDLAYRFGVSQSTVSRCIKKIIDIMYVRLDPIINWPAREEMLQTMPMDFRKHFSKCIVIIDCFEVFIERPTNLMARAQTWSNYKSHNTVKFLIGISPQGAITYISKAWGGRVSDVYLTEHCGILDNLSPGDLILADRGFNIHDSTSLLCAEVKMPAFTRGKKQLSKAEVDISCQLSSVRIHIERVIGMV